MRDKRARVLLLFWGRRGGGSLFTRYLANDLSRQQDFNVLVSLRGDNDQIDAFRHGELPLVELQTGSLRALLSHPVQAITAVYRHLQALRKWRPDVVIITMNGPLTWPLAGLLKHWGSRLIYVAHDARPHPGDYARLWQLFTQRRLIAQADLVVALSKFVAQALSEQGEARKVEVVPLDAVYPDQRRPSDIPKRRHEVLKLLVMGRLIRYKGFDALHDAVQLLSDTTGWAMTIAGSGPLETEIRECFSAFPNISLELNWLSQARMDELILAHDLLLCAYSEASQSGLVADALAFGVPVLVSSKGALPEQVGYCEAAMTDGSAEQIADRLGHFIQNPESLQHIKNPLDRTFFVNKEGDKWGDLIRSLLRELPARRYRH